MQRDGVFLIYSRNIAQRIARELHIQSWRANWWSVSIRELHAAVNIVTLILSRCSFSLWPCPQWGRNLESKEFFQLISPILSCGNRTPYFRTAPDTCMRVMRRGGQYNQGGCIMEAFQRSSGDRFRLTGDNYSSKKLAEFRRNKMGSFGFTSSRNAIFWGMGSMFLGTDYNIRIKTNTISQHIYNLFSEYLK